MALESQAQLPRGIVYDPNPVVADGLTEEVDLIRLPDAAITLDGQDVSVSSCVISDGSCSAVQYALADDNGNFLFPPDEGASSDPFAEVNAYFHMQRAVDYFSEEHGMRWQCSCGDSVLNVFLDPRFDAQTVSSLAFYQYHNCEAFRCGAIVLARSVNNQGQLVDSSYDGDIAYHEYVHAIVDQRTLNQSYLEDNRGASYEPGAVSEGVADFFAAVISNDPWIAEHLAGVGEVDAPDALRNIAEIRTCPSDLSGQPHQDGRILSSALWRLHNELPSTPLAQFLLQSVLESGAQPTFSKIVEGILLRFEDDGNASEANQAAEERAREVFIEHGLTGCDRIAPLAEGQTKLLHPGHALIGSINQGLAPVQVLVEVPAGISSLQFNLDVDSSTALFSLHVRGEQPIELSEDKQDVLSDLVFPVQDGTVVIAASEELWGEEGGSFFVAVQLETILEGNPWFTLSYSTEKASKNGGAGCAVSAEDGFATSWCWIMCCVALIIRRRLFYRY